MPIPDHILRGHADDLPNARPKWSARELDREDRILATACALIARYGRANLTFRSLATAMRLAPATIRRHFTDLDSILFELICRHLMAISRALGTAPHDHPNRRAAMRAAYVEFTRNAFSATTPAHTLLIRERHALPADLLDHVEKLRLLIGDTLAPDHPEIILDLLDNPFLQPPHIETMLGAFLNPDPRPAKTEIITYPRQFHPKAPKSPCTPFPTATATAHARAGPVRCPSAQLKGVLPRETRSLMHAQRSLPAPPAQNDTGLV